MAGRSIHALTVLLSLPVCLAGWLESVTKFGAASFLEAAKYFVPVPVALVQITEG